MTLNQEIAHLVQVRLDELGLTAANLKNVRILVAMNDRTGRPRTVFIQPEYEFSPDRPGSNLDRNKGA